MRIMKQESNLTCLTCVHEFRKMLKNTKGKLTLGFEAISVNFVKC